MELTLTTTPEYLTEALVLQRQVENTIIGQEQSRRIAYQRLILDRSWQAEERQRCERDREHFVNQWIWTYDPRNVGTELPTRLPFTLRPKQAAFLNWLDERLVRKENGLVEKSRAEGATWLAVLWVLHRWLFADKASAFTAGFGSSKLELVDTIGDLKAILPKLRYALDYLPRWLRPLGFRSSVHALHKRIINPENGSIISGEGGSEMGRGGRSSIFFLDEHSHLPQANQIDQALSNTTDTIIYIGTPFGMGNLFYSKRHDATTPVFTFFWRDNPAKNFTSTRPHAQTGKPETYYPWYEHISSKFDPVLIAQEVDLDYSASQSGTFVPGKWVQAAVHLWETRRHEVDSTRIEAALDVGEGVSETVYGCRVGPLLMRLVAWRSDDVRWSSNEAIRLATEDDAAYMLFDEVGPGADMSGTLRTKKREYAARREADKMAPLFPFRFTGYNGGHKCSTIRYGDDPRTTARDRFLNRKAEDQWGLRLRFYRSWLLVEGRTEVKLDDCILIPPDPLLLAQCTVVKYLETDTGKLRSETKKELSARGVASPDRWEMLYMLFSAHKPTLQVF